ncbi:MarR family winged helix-turn-helix transcriptional regulator [Pseudonocardia sp. KRD291]|uniref:MarR family winged helix-turn-helix transcriptional regulator n=1 Tax=Pseudonocardia sp. KRD291 TaxID=2792007 RepID=UPI001C4A281D|nr:MarR family transcriptional regulator [Pseudonocardia sp. KRD291]MBW0103070.1 MarR family transcriptional regulator [Pseudonocardia sp. KRD291]
MSAHGDQHPSTDATPIDQPDRTDHTDEETSEVDTVLGLLARLEIGSMLFRQALTERLGLNETEHLVLDLLIQHGDLNGSQLGGITGLSSGAISGLAQRLERSGLVTRTPDPYDGRRRVLKATEAARRHVEETVEELRLREPRRAGVDLLYGLSSDDLHAVTIFLSRATDRAFRQARSLRFAQREPSRWRSRGSTSRPAPPRSVPG